MTQYNRARLFSQIHFSDLFSSPSFLELIAILHLPLFPDSSNPHRSHVRSPENQLTSFLTLRRPSSSSPLHTPDWTSVREIGEVMGPSGNWWRQQAEGHCDSKIGVVIVEDGKEKRIQGWEREERHYNKTIVLRRFT